jgi:Tol biopolymer transport system component
VVYIRGDYGQQDFWLLDLVNGNRRQLTNLQPGFSIKGFDVSKDGTQIIFDRVRENSDVVLIELPPAQQPSR